MYLMGIMRGDLTSDFFINPEHRSRFEAGRNAAERRGWNVISVIPTEHEEEVYCAVVEETHSFTLEDNILTGNCHHNFAAQEVFNGVPMWITRKGAIRAQKGDLGMIPGSMGAQSYIIEGLGNELSWNSCAHGAGRIMSRGDAKRAFTVADIEEQMQGKTWLSSRAAGQIDEIPGAYKDIDQVMADQRDLVSVHHVLRQVLNFKGC
jgi:RNA-splicing ligase RtcB